MNGTNGVEGVRPVPVKPELRLAAKREKAQPEVKLTPTNISGAAMVLIQSWREFIQTSGVNLDKSG